MEPPGDNRVSESFALGFGMLPPDPLSDVAYKAACLPCFFDCLEVAIFSKFSILLSTERISTASILLRLSTSSAYAIYFETPLVVCEILPLFVEVFSSFALAL